MTSAEAAKVVAVLMAAFPNNRASTQTAQVYEEFLQDLEYKLVNAAIRRLVTTAKFMPSIAEIREACVETNHGQVRPGGDAWGDVLSAVRKFGIYRQPSFADPVVARAVQSLGWEEICNSENQAADRARFIELYDKLSKAQRREAQVHGGAELPQIAPRNSEANALVLQLAASKGVRS